MNKLYEKNEITFAILCIVAYVVLFSTADNLSAAIGITKVLTAPVCLAATVLLFVWIKKKGLSEKYGLCKSAVSPARLLWFIPLIAISSVNLWNGLRMNYSPLETVLYVASMLCVGFLEEVIFRGFLFKALCKSGIKRAIIISGLTFGMGHIVNLLRGVDVISTLLQLCYASALGILFAIIFYKSGSIIPCVLSHAAINVTSTFAVDRTDTVIAIESAVLVVVSVIYALLIIKLNPQKTKQSE